MLSTSLGPSHREGPTPGWCFLRSISQKGRIVQSYLVSSILKSAMCVVFEHIKLPAKLLYYFLRSTACNINQNGPHHKHYHHPRWNTRGITPVSHVVSNTRRTGLLDTKGEVEGGGEREDAERRGV